MRCYARPRAAAEQAEAESWWADVSAGPHAWRSLRGAVASLRCETRAALRTGSSFTVVAEVVAVHRPRRTAGVSDGAGLEALHYKAEAGYYAA